MSKLLFTILLLFSFSVTGNAQIAQGQIKGTVIDSKTKDAIDYVTVALIPQGKTTPTTGASTDEDGTFIISGVKAGNYTLRFSFMGYTEETKAVKVPNNQSKVNVGKIALKPDAKMLKEVVITEQRSQMSFEIDKKVFTVDQNIAATGGSASDVLTDIPSVEVSNEGAVSLRGSESVTVWINGKASGLTSDNQGDILQQMPAESIEKIEIITNPSAKHSPEGTAGIINIVLKRNRKAGYYGSFQGGGDTQGGYNASGNINYSSGKLDAYANASYRMRTSENGGESYTRYFDRDNFQQQSNDGERSHGNIFGRAGLNWHFTTKDDLYINLMGMTGEGKSNSAVITNSGNITSGGISEKRTRLTDSKSTPRMYNIEGGYKHSFTESHFVDLSLSHNMWKFGNESKYNQTNEYLESGREGSMYQFQNGDNNNKSTEIKLDYENKLNENNRIEAGYRASFSRENSPVYTYNDQAHTQIEETLFNRFIYKQQIHALYATYAGKIDKFGYQAGLRGEYWKVRTRSLTWQQEIGGTTPPYSNNEFFNLFPSAFLSYALPKNNEIQINYTRRLRRPWGRQLNSFRNISDSTNISFGNPELTPEYSNAFELNYIKNWNEHTLSLSGYFRTTDDVIERIGYNSDDVIYTTYENVAKSSSAGLEIIGKNRLWKKFDLTTTVNLFYYKLDGFNYLIEQQEVTGDADENFSWNARMSGSLILPWGIMAQATGRFDARRIVAQGYMKSSYSLDLGLRKSFDTRWSLSLNVRDLFNSRRWHTITGDNSFSREVENWHAGRRFGATLTYSFGNMKAKKSNKRQDENGAADSYNSDGIYE